MPKDKMVSLLYNWLINIILSYNYIDD
jgi:hypothetical protein